ncbi:MAG: extracellular solute-binding protein [Planctomycetota bacterium]|nr:extracellular solute-binding protein [Planctomycetota bacterium]
MASRTDFLYHRICERIVRDARTADRKAGDELPTIQELTRLYGVSETPVRRALAQLQRSGQVRSVRGRGTYWLTAPALSDEPTPPSETPAWQAYSPFVQTRASARLALHLIDGFPTHRAMWLGLIERFQSRNGAVRVEARFGQDTSALLREQATDGIDLCQYTERDVGRAAEQGRLLPLHEQDLGLDRLPPFATLPAEHGGGVYGLPLTLSLPVQYANAELIAKAGLEAPGEAYGWPDFLALVEGLASARREGRLLPETLACASQDHAFPFLAARSLAFVDPETRRIDWTHPDVLEFFREWRRLGCEWRGIPSNAELQARGGMHGLFAQGRLGLICMYAIFREMIPGGLPPFARVLPLPLGAGGCAVWTANYLTVQARGLQRQAALEFLRFLYSDEARRVVARSGCCHALAREPRRANGAEALRFETAALARARPSSWFGRENLRVIGEVFAPLADQVRDGLYPPEEAVELLARTAARAHP